MKLSTVVSRRKKALKSASPKSRDRLRRELRVALIAELLRKEGRHVAA